MGIMYKVIRERKMCTRERVGRRSLQLAGAGRRGEDAQVLTPPIRPPWIGMCSLELRAIACLLDFTTGVNTTKGASLPHEMFN